VSDHSKLTYPNGLRGGCGDPHYETKWDNPGEVTATYVPGQVINIDTVIAVNHMGKFEVEICPLDAKPGQGKCQPLTLKAPGHSNSKSWWLPGIPKWEGGNYGGEGPRYGAAFCFVVGGGAEGGVL